MPSQAGRCVAEVLAYGPGAVGPVGVTEVGGEGAEAGLAGLQAVQGSADPDAAAVRAPAAQPRR